MSLSSVNLTHASMLIVGVAIVFLFLICQVLFDAVSSLVFCSSFSPPLFFFPCMSRGFKQSPLWKESSWPLTWAFWRCGSGCEAKSRLWRCLSVSGLIQTTPRRHTLTGSPRSYSGPFTPRGTSCSGWSGLWPRSEKHLWYAKCFLWTSLCLTREAVSEY